jgi:hypothetical protein
MNFGLIYKYFKKSLVNSFKDVKLAPIINHSLSSSRNFYFKHLLAMFYIILGVMCLRAHVKNVKIEICSKNLNNQFVKSLKSKLNTQIL